MNKQNFAVRVLSVSLAALIVAPQGWATCGGGGGGGLGGMKLRSMNTEEQKIYHVPWRVRAPSDPPLDGGLVVFWVPSTPEEVQKSSLRASRVLSLYSAQCVAMELVAFGSPEREKLAADAKPPVALLATADGSVVGKAENKNGYLMVEQVEKLVESEVKQRENAVEQQLKQAKEKAKSGDNSGAIQMYRAALEQKCMFPKKAKDAAKELKKLGVTDVGRLFDAPMFDPRESAKIDGMMRDGQAAEEQAKYVKAERLYQAAHRMDPADPVPLRYLGELYRHHTGEWEKARSVFEQILDMPADPLSRAVALHGLGKMTIHEGDFAKGLSLIETSVKEFPLALAYRNLAVYWNSEGNAAKTDQYVQKALAVDPDDPYNLVFAAVFMANNGHGDQALKIARENEALLPASYNLAAIYAQAGQREKALELLKRHFFEYERYQAVRSKEMMEARVDAVFASLKDDANFVSLTSGADGKLDPAKAMKAATR